MGNNMKNKMDSIISNTGINKKKDKNKSNRRNKTPMMTLVDRLH